MEAFTAFDLRFAAYSFHPFVGTSRRIPRATGLPVVPSQREHVRPTGEQASEQVNLFVRRRSIRDGGVLEGGLFHGWRGLCSKTSLKCRHLALKLMPFSIQIGQPRSNPRQVFLNIVLVGHA